MSEAALRNSQPIAKLITFDELFEREMQDPEFRAEWERSAPARALADIIGDNRLRKGLTQTALARLVGVSQPVIARIEAHEHTPTIETLIKLAIALDIELLIGIAPAGKLDPVLVTVPDCAQEVRQEVTIRGARLIISTS